jgi:phosphate transport system permease protein
LVVVINGAGYFWPHKLTQADVRGAGRILGVIAHTEKFRKFNPTNAEVEVLGRSQFKVGNRDVDGADFKWIEQPELSNLHQPANAVALEREEYGDFYGDLKAIKEAGRVVAEGEAAWKLLREKQPLARDIARRRLNVQKVQIGEVNAAIQKATLEIKRAQRRHSPGPERDAAIARAQTIIDTRQKEFEKLRDQAYELQVAGKRFVAVMVTADGREKDVSLADIVRAYRPNAMSMGAKLGHYAAKVWEFVSGEPRESNTEGGIFPAIFGTVVMTLLMSIAVVPFGVLAAFYLREYAKQGSLSGACASPSTIWPVFPRSSSACLD